MDRPVPIAAVWLARAAAGALFVAVLLLRGGPISAQNDAQAVTQPTTAVSHGDLGRAEAETTVPDPPGYAVLAAPFVVLLRPWIGSPNWCSDRHVPAAGGAASAFYRALARPCGAQRGGARGALPHWYGSQGVLGVAAWLVLLAGAQLLLRTVHGRPTAGEMVAAFGLAVLPASSDALVESFHPQDLVAVGFVCMALSQALRHRWGSSGLLMATAMVSKQFAVLALPALVVAAPGVRPRARLVASCAAVCLAVVLPFWVADPSDTLHALSGTFVQGAGVIRSATVVGLLGVHESLKLHIARDAPVVAAATLAAVAVWWRSPDRVEGPVPVIGLVLAGMAARLVFEVSVYGYYLLAVGALLLVLELARGDLPVRTAAWVVVTRYGILGGASSLGPWWVAAALGVASGLALAWGLSGAVGPRPAPGAVRAGR